MPQLDFILSEKERIEVVQFLFKNDCRIIPGCHYSTSKYNIVTDMEGYLKYCKEEPLLFLINDRYSFYPLELDFFENEKGKTYFIKQRHGGPTIDFFSPIIGEKENNIIGPGFIGIYEYYYHNNNKIAPNADLKNIYKLLISYIQSISKAVKLSNRTYWVGNYTINQARSGKFKLEPISDIEILELV